jgi:predicted site-specific integrase-resolvase
VDELDLDARLTIRQVVQYFGGDVSYRAVDQWVRRGLIPHVKDTRGRITVRLGDALDAEAATHMQARGRPRKTQALAA